MSTSYSTFTMAAVQASPIYFDRDASTQKACALIRQAADQGATIAVFGETWLPGYPAFHSRSAVNQKLWWEAAAEYQANAVEIPSPTTDRLCAAAKASGIDVVIGVAELDTRTKGTVYCTILFISSDGVILGRHRKLKPTGSERMVWGDGDADGLVVYERPYGRISGLACWEHNMALPGYALMAQGTQIHAAVWPGREPTQGPPAPISIWTRQLLLSRAFASQAASYVVLAGGMRLDECWPDRYTEIASSGAGGGDSYIIDPRGEVIAGPAEGETILMAEGSMEMVHAAKAACDITGHYSRPDIFQLLVNGIPATQLNPRKGPVGTVDGNSEALSSPEPATQDQAN